MYCHFPAWANRQVGTTPLRDPIPIKKELFPLVVTLATPALFFVLVEPGVRMAGFGQSCPLFVERNKVSQDLGANHEIVKRFVIDVSKTPDVCGGVLLMESLNITQ